MATREESNVKFLSEESQQRTLKNHLRLCEMIEEVDNAPAIRDRLSTTYGINRKSILAKVENFDICQCFPHDIMHIVLEGVVPYETKLLLRVLIDEKKFLTLSTLNLRMASFNYGYMDSKNQPSPIARETINGRESKLKQSASQMWCLFRYLPIMIGDVVDKDLEQWHCFLKLWNIVQICTAPAIRREDVPLLKILIEEHHNLFKEIYPLASIIPKLHYMIHIPDDIIRFGPPRNYWSMRFEAKHAYFKRALSCNFKNVCKTVACRHQRFMCWNLLTSPGQAFTNFLYEGDTVPPGNHNIDLSQHPLLDKLCDSANLLEIPAPFTGSRLESVSIHGIEYRSGCALRIKEMGEFGESDYPEYGHLDEVVVWNDGKYFVVTVLKTILFKYHYMAYEVQSTDEKRVVLPHNLPSHSVLNIIKKEGKLYIVEKESANIEDLFM